jgi:signal transduction histidine kinase
MPAAFFIPGDRQAPSVLGSAVLESAGFMMSPDSDVGSLQAEAAEAAEAVSAEAEPPSERTSYDLLSMVNHELRTPLTAIQGALGLLAGGMAGELPEKARALVDIAVRNTERLGRLISELLDLAIIPPGTFDGKGEEAERQQPADPSLAKK